MEIYKDEIIKNQKKKIDQLEYNLKKKKFPVKGAIILRKMTMIKFTEEIKLIYLFIK